MGNIQLEQTYSKRKPIFNKTDSKTKGKSPEISTHRRENPYRTIKNVNQMTSSGVNSDLIDTNRSNRVQGRLNGNSTARESARGDTSSRVNNLNQFLIELRKQMKDHQNDEQSKASGSRMEKVDSSGKIHQLVLNLRLQNEKLQVEKYKKLVERELEKSHSIEEIQLLGNQSDKKLIIKYEEIKNSKANKQQNFVNHSSLAQKIKEQQIKYMDKLNRAKQLQQKLNQRAQSLEMMLIQYEKNKIKPKASGQQNKQQPISFSENNEDIPTEYKRVNKIEGLMKQIDQLHKSQRNAEREIRAALQKREDSESEVSFQEH